MKKSYLRKENDLSTYIAETGEGMKNNMTSDGHGIANIGGRNKPACKSELPRIHRNMASIFSMGLALLGFLVIGLSTTSSTAFAGFPNLLGSHASNRSSQPSISFHKRQNSDHRNTSTQGEVGLYPNEKIRQVSHLSPEAETSSTSYLMDGNGYGDAALMPHAPLVAEEHVGMPTEVIEPHFPRYDHWQANAYEPWHWQVLPDGLIYRSYLAGMKESRFASMWVKEKDHGWLWDVALGGRVAILRYGTNNCYQPEGWELDIEGAGLPRLDLENDRDLMSSDFRFGVPLTYGTKQWQYKFAYYHLSSHLGDEHMIRTGDTRINYVRDSLVLGVSYQWTDTIRLYGEAAWAFYTGEKTKPWEFQFGAEYSPLYPSGGLHGAPFFAINGHLREEVDYGGNVTVQTGWQWRGPSNHLFRMGLQYFAGMSEQYEFYDDYESKIGLGLWYDY